MVSEYLYIIFKIYYICLKGRKKCGKSTLTELITGENANASANIGTEITKPYKISLNNRITHLPNNTSNELKTILMDYPHFDGTDLSNKLQFIFSRYLLDHIFMVCTAMDRMDGDDTKIILNLVQSGNNTNYHVLINRCDDFWRDCKNDVSKAIEVYNQLKQEILNRRIRTTDSDKVLLTCLGNVLEFDEQDALYRSKILLKDELKLHVFEIISKIFRLVGILYSFLCSRMNVCITYL